MPIRNVRDAMHDLQRGSKHITTREQAIAVGLKAERERKAKPKRGKHGRVAALRKGRS